MQWFLGSLHSESSRATFWWNSNGHLSWTSNLNRTLESELKYLFSETEIDSSEEDLLIETQSSEVIDINLQSSRGRTNAGNTSYHIVASFSEAEIDQRIIVVVFDWENSSNTFIDFGRSVWSASIIAHIGGEQKSVIELLGVDNILGILGESEGSFSDIEWDLTC